MLRLAFITSIVLGAGLLVTVVLLLLAPRTTGPDCFVVTGANSCDETKARPVTVHKTYEFGWPLAALGIAAALSAVGVTSIVVNRRRS